MDVDRPLPHNPDAERAVLGAILFDNSKLADVRSRLSASDFFLDQHRRVFQQMIMLGEAQQAIDLVTLTDQLHRQGELEAAGGAAYVAQLVDGVPRVSNVEHYARIIKENAARREVIHATYAAYQQSSEPDTDLEAVTRTLQGRLERVCTAVEHVAGEWDGDAQVLADKLRSFVRRFVSLTVAQVGVIVLWILHGYAFQVAEATAYLSLTSAEK